MKYAVYIVLIIFLMPADIVFDFSENSDTSDWVVVVDGVMGGNSSAAFERIEEGYARFTGQISLENNGGFASVRYRFPEIDVTKFTTIHLRARGDGKKYQFRVKDNARNYFSYTSHFDTSGEWEDIAIELKYMYPVYRGRILNLPDFSADQIAEVTILFGNREEEPFALDIQCIYLE